MKIISYNVNGIRSAFQKGADNWLLEQKADFICMQEIKASADQMPIEGFLEKGYRNYAYPAEKKGYSGVAILSAHEPTAVHFGMGVPEFDREGRVIRLDFPKFSLISVYFPSGTSGDERQQLKYQFMDDFEKHVESLRKEGKSLIICGDVNICHKTIDIHNPISNKNSTGFLPEERAWLDHFTGMGYVDTFRVFHPEPHQYTWWSFRANSRQNNKGWRIDYQFITPDLRPALQDAGICPEAVHSDHCPTYTIFNNLI